MKLAKSLFILILVLSLLAGCAANSGGSDSGQTDAPALQPGAGNYEVPIPELGMTVTVPRELMDLGMDLGSLFETEEGYQGLSVCYYHLPVVEPLMAEYQRRYAEDPDSITEEYFMSTAATLQENTLDLLHIVLVPEADFQARSAAGESMSLIAGEEGAPVTNLGSNEGFVYLALEPSLNTEALAEELVKGYELCKAQLGLLLENLELGPIAAEDTAPSDKIGPFTTVDLEGNTVTEAIFADKDLTVINIWGTFCTPCIGEMPELGQWARELPDNVQLIGLVSDISGTDDTQHIELAKQIMEKSGASFLNLLPSQDFMPLLNTVVGVPTTIFVDSQGNLVGEPIVGAYVQGYKDFVEAYLNG